MNYYLLIKIASTMGASASYMYDFSDIHNQATSNRQQYVNQRNLDKKYKNKIYKYNKCATTCMNRYGYDVSGITDLCSESCKKQIFVAPPGYRYEVGSYCLEETWWNAHLDKCKIYYMQGDTIIWYYSYILGRIIHD